MQEGRGLRAGRRDVEKEKQGREGDGREGGQKQEKLVAQALSFFAEP